MRHIITPQDIQSLYWLKQNVPGVTVSSRAKHRSTQRDFSLSVLEIGQRVSVAKPSHMCLPAPELGSVAQLKAAALIKFP